MKNKITTEITYAHSVEKVWQALTNAEAMSQWLMPCNIKPEVGHQFEFRTKPSPGFDGIVKCEVLEIKEKELLVFSWSGGSLENTRVSFQLTALGDQTKLSFEHSGFQGFFNKLIVRKILANGWKKQILIKKLPKYLQHE